MSGQRKALIVASGEYDHEGLRQLLSPAADAEALGTVLGDPQIGDFDVQVVANETSHIIQAQIEDLFSDSVRDDLLLLHLSCHGLKNDSGELFFAARNTRLNRLGSTAIPADFVRRCMRSSRSRSIVLLLDCCYGGAFGQGVTVRATGDVNVLDSFPGDKLGGGRGRAVITASSSMEYAFEGDQLADDHSQRPSVFTSALVEGLATGDADRDEDGWVSLNELYDYVFDRVREQNPHQTPSRDVEMQGDLYVARSRRRRIRPLAIPVDLQAAMADPNMFTRLGAVTELRSRLASDNLPVATGARDALADIARTDIQYLAEAAATALREVAIHTVERELHFGRVVRDSSPPRRTVHLLGPPLARACTFQASDSWIRIDETTDGIHVSVETSQVGTRRGDITIKGFTGDIVIPVDVEVTPEPEPPPPASAPSSPAGWRIPSPVTTVAAILTGVTTVVCGLVVLGNLVTPHYLAFRLMHNSYHISSSALWIALCVQLIAYGVFSLVQSFTAGEGEGDRRKWLLIAGVLALFFSVLALSGQAVGFVGVFFFWVLAGGIEAVAALKDTSRPTRRLEIASGALGEVAGILVVIFAIADKSEKNAGFTLGIWLLILGVLVLAIGVKQGRLAWIGSR